MKIGAGRIIRDHFATLRNDATGKRSVADLITFLFLPTLPAFTVLFVYLPHSNDLVSAFISIVAIFSALLVGAQFSLYGLFRREPEQTGDEIRDQEIRAQKQREVNVLREINSTISYLILVGVLSVVVALSLLVVTWSGSIEASILIYILGHFLLTLMVVVKRVHVLLDRGYNWTPSK